MIYIVEKGDTLEKISERTGVPVWKIVYDNQIENRDRIAQGQALLLLQAGENGGLAEGKETGAACGR